MLAAIVIEGAARKWFLPASLHLVAYGAKDVIAVLFILTHPVRPTTPEFLKKLRRSILIADVLLLPAFIVGISRSPASACLTAKNAVLWPLFALYLAANLTPKEIEKLGRLVMLLACGMALLSSAQFVLPATHPLNRYAWDAAGISTMSAMMDVNTVRATGTFSYLTGLQFFGMFAFAWSTFRFTTNTGGKMLNGLALLSSLVCILTSGSRAAMLFCFVSVFGALVGMRWFSGAVRLVIMLCASSIVLWLMPSKAFIESYVYRARTAPDTLRERVVEPLLSFVAVIAEEPFGRGLGQDSQALVYNDSVALGSATIGAFEDGKSRAAFEAGLFGIISLFLVLTALLRVTVLGLRAPDLRTRAATGAIGFMFCLQVFQCLWFDHVATALFWFLGAIWISSSFRARPTGTMARWRYQ